MIGILSENSFSKVTLLEGLPSKLWSYKKIRIRSIETCGVTRLVMNSWGIEGFSMIYVSRELDLEESKGLLARLYDWHVNVQISNSRKGKCRLKI